MTILLLTAMLIPGPVEVEYHERLESAARLPVVFHPRDSRLLYLKTKGEGDQQKFVYCTASLVGKQQKELYATAVDWDDLLVAFQHAAVFGSNGQTLVAATLQDESPRGKMPDQVVPALIDAEGNVQKLPLELGQAMGFGFSGSHVLILDTPGLDGAGGYQLKRWDGKQTTVLDEHKSRRAAVLRVNSAGTRAAFLILENPQRREVRVRVVSTEAGEPPVESPSFRSDDVTFDGLPLITWNAAGDGLFCHVCTEPQGKLPFELTLFRTDRKQGERVSEDKNTGMVAALDSRWAAVWVAPQKGSSLLDLQQRTLTALPAGVVILGGRGKHCVVLDRKTNDIFTATLRIK